MPTPTHHDKNGQVIAIGDLVQFHNFHGKLKRARVTSMLPTCVKAFTSFSYYADGKHVTGEGDFPLAPLDCEVIDASPS